MKRLMGLVMALGLLAGCGGAEEGALPRAEVTLSGPGGAHLVVRAEVAATDAAREQGLMYRTHMDDDAGMLFVWPQAQRVGFWMKNTRLPLDMLFIAGGKVVALAPRMKPMDETTVSPPMAVDMVLEVNGGWAEARKISGPGWTVAVSSTALSARAPAPHK
jgi:uncharacterized membrane protein (UPF0127 family)